MSLAVSAETPIQLSPSLKPRLSESEILALGDSIAALAARLHAATYELLVQLGRFDACCGWNNGFLSCAHWLHWRTGIDLGAAREKVRVARALPALPLISAAMARGRLSYAKVRAVTRIATPANEQTLLNFAVAGTAAHVERFVCACRRVDAAQAARDANARHLRRRLSTWVDRDGMVVICGRLSPEIGAVVQRALEAAADQLFQEGKSAPTGQSFVEEVSWRQRRADALALIAESALSAGLDAGTASDRYQVVVHVTASPATDAVEDSGICDAPVDGALELDHGPVHVSAETSRRIACDASAVRMDHTEDGRVVDSGRKTRTVPPSIRRALAARDRHCVFPGCTSRRCDAHHIDHWADGGPTTMENLMLLCRRHHRSVHEGGFVVHRTAGGPLAFIDPHGRPLPTAPPSAEGQDWNDVLPTSVDRTPTWDGTRFNLAWAVDVLYDRVMASS